jgi:protein phosphatase
MVPETRISEILVESPDDPETPVRRLLSAALDAGGNDNVTVVVVDLKERVQREGPSGDTREMPSVAPTGDEDPETGRARARRSPRTRNRGEASRRQAASRRKRKRSAGLGRFARGLAIVLVFLVALTPAYLWGSSRYFLGVEEGEVVAYRGLPYAPLGVELNEEWLRTEVELSEVKTPYRAPIETHKLYTRAEIQGVVEDLGK